MGQRRTRVSDGVGTWPPLSAWSVGNRVFSSAHSICRPLADSLLSRSSPQPTVDSGAMIRSPPKLSASTQLPEDPAFIPSPKRQDAASTFAAALVSATARLLGSRASRNPFGRGGCRLGRVEAASRRFRPTRQAARCRFYFRWRVRIGHSPLIWFLPKPRPIRGCRMEAGQGRSGVSPL